MELITKKQTKKNAACKVVALWLMAIVAIFSIASAEQTSDNVIEVAAEVSTSSGESTAVDTEEVEVVIEESQAELVDDAMDGAAIQSISFVKDMTIKDALRFLSLKYQKNIVPTPKIDGMITVTNLYDVTFEEALQALIGANKFEVQGNFIMVYTAEEYEQIMNDKRRMEYRVFELYYLTADEAMKMVTPVLSGDGGIEASTPSAVGISEGDSISVEEGGASLALRDTLVVKDYPENIVEIETLLEKLDIRPLQVLIEATILSATLTEEMQFGIDINMAGGVAIDGTLADASASTPVAQLMEGIPGANIETAGFASAGANGLRFGITSGDISAFINAIETVTDVTVLANPKILALNKQVGTVFVGQKLGYRSSTSLSSEGVATEGTVEFLNSGTKLSFRPYIADDGYIRMDIYPKDSSASLNNDGVPTETTAELTTNIMVKDGQTVVIGGLFRDDITTTRSQVPLLGDIPLIGALFRGTTDTNVRKEVIVLITPTIIEDPSELDSEDRAADIGRKRQSAMDQMQWFGRARRADDKYSKAVALYTEGDLEGALCELNTTLRLRPTYYEATQLRERIIREIAGGDEKMLERVMIDIVEREENEKWIRL